ncbi:hypothetical protein ACLOJK_040848 [Asimina triloba]
MGNRCCWMVDAMESLLECPDLDMLNFYGEGDALLCHGRCSAPRLICVAHHVLLIVKCLWATLVSSMRLLLLRWKMGCCDLPWPPDYCKVAGRSDECSCTWTNLAGIFGWTWWVLKMGVMGMGLPLIMKEAGSESGSRRGLLQLGGQICYRRSSGLVGCHRQIEVPQRLPSLEKREALPSLGKKLPPPLSLVDITGDSGDGLRSRRFWDPVLAAVLMGGSYQLIGASPAVISLAARKTMSYFGVFDLFAMYAFMDEEDDGTWIISSSSSFWPEQIYKSDVARGAMATDKYTVYSDPPEHGAPPICISSPTPTTPSARASSDGDHDIFSYASDSTPSSTRAQRRRQSPSTQIQPLPPDAAAHRPRDQRVSRPRAADAIRLLVSVQLLPTAAGEHRPSPSVADQSTVRPPPICVGK